MDRHPRLQAYGASPAPRMGLRGTGNQGTEGPSLVAIELPSQRDLQFTQWFVLFCRGGSPALGFVYTRSRSGYVYVLGACGGWRTI
jgi:hypothetical protein